MTMYLLKFDPEARTLNEVPGGELHADPRCRYFYVQAKRVTVPTFTPEGWGEIVWQHPDWTPPPPIIRRRPWHKRLLRFPRLVWQNMRLGLSFPDAFRISLPLLHPCPGGIIAPRGNVDIAHGYQPKPSGDAQTLPPPRNP